MSSFPVSAYLHPEAFNKSEPLCRLPGATGRAGLGSSLKRHRSAVDRSSLQRLTRSGDTIWAGLAAHPVPDRRAEAERAFQLTERPGGVRDGRNALVGWAVLLEG